MAMAPLLAPIHPTTKTMMPKIATGQASLDHHGRPWLDDGKRWRVSLGGPRR